jgi:hypothetical protein
LLKGSDSGCDPDRDLTNPADALSFSMQLKEVQATARLLRVRLQNVEARGPEDFDAAFAAMARERAEGLLAGSSSTFLAHRARLAELRSRRGCRPCSGFAKASRRAA